MSYTVLAAPSVNDSMFSPLWFRVGSSAAAATNYRYLFDVYVGGVQVAALKIIPDNTLAGVVDLSRIIRNYASTYFTPDTMGEPISIGTDKIVLPFDVHFGEEITVSGVTTVYRNLFSVTYYASYTYNSEAPTTGHPYAPLYGYDHNWLTTRDISAVWMRRGGNAFLPYWNFSVEDPTIWVEELDDNGTPLGTQYTSNPIGATNKLVVFNLNPTRILGSSWAGSTPPFLSSATCAGYRILVRRPVGAGGALTQWVYVRYLCEARTPAVPLHFLNRLGGYDTFCFTGPSRRNKTIVNKTLEQIPVFNGGSSFSEFDANAVFTEGTVAFTTNHTNTRHLISGYLNDTNMLWLSELLASPQIYLEEGGFYFPVQVVTKTWAQKLNSFDKMYNLEIDVTMGRKVISQTR